MRKKFAGLLTGLLVFSITGSMVYGAENLVEMEPSDQTTVTSYLTGEQVSEAAGRRRPVAVMMGNNRPAVPQSGISGAGVIYEAPVEGNMTRLMAIYEDYDSLSRIGSVRSCRDYYLFYANEFDAIYSHFGQAVYALKYLDQGLIDNLNGLNMEGTSYFRIPERKAPHNAYASGDTLKAGIEAKGYRTAYKEGYNGHYLFAEEGTEFVPEEESAQMLSALIISQITIRGLSMTRIQRNTVVISMGKLRLMKLRESSLPVIIFCSSILPGSPMMLMDI